MKNFLSFLIVVLTCIISYAFDKSPMLRTMSVTPFKLFAIRLLVLALLLLIAGMFCGSQMQTKAKGATALLVFFLLLLAVCVALPFVEPFIPPFPQASFVLLLIGKGQLFIYILAFYTGLFYKSSKKRTSSL